MKTPKAAAAAADLGRRLRLLRQRCGLSLRHVAATSGVAASMISVMERQCHSPSIATLQKVLAALGTDLASFFGRAAPMGDGPVFHREHMKLIGDAERSYTLVFPRRPGVRVELLDEHLTPARRRPVFERLACDVAGYVLAGTLALEVRGQRPRLVRVGDSFYIPKQTEHRGYVSGREPVRVISVSSPPRY